MQRGCNFQGAAISKGFAQLVSLKDPNDWSGLVSIIDGNGNTRAVKQEGVMGLLILTKGASLASLCQTLLLTELIRFLLYQICNVLINSYKEYYCIKGLYYLSFADVGWY